MTCQIVEKLLKTAVDLRYVPGFYVAALYRACAKTSSTNRILFLESGKTSLENQLNYT